MAAENQIFLALIAFVVVQRLAELRRSVINQRALRAQGFARKDSPAEFTVMVALHVTWLIAMVLENQSAPTFLPPTLKFLAAATFLLGQLIRFWALTTLGTHWNTNVMAPKAGAPGLNFIATGPYRFIRHPNYLAVILEIFSLPLVGGALCTALFFSVANLLILIKRIREEERWLLSRPGYEASVGRLPRFIPGVRWL